MKKKLLSIASTIATFLILFAVLFPFTGSPRQWDDLLYISSAGGYFITPITLNRCTHVFGLKAFIWLAGDPFLGARLFWTTIVILIGTITFWTIAISPQKKPLQAAAFGAAFFLLGPDILQSFGLAFVDTTLCLIFTSVLLLLSTERFTSKPRILMFALGGMVLLGFKTKEPAVALIFFPAAILFDVAKKQPKFTAITSTGIFLSGILVAQALICGLDWMILGNPFYSLDIENWMALRSNLNNPANINSKYTFLTIMLSGDYAVITLLYIFVITKLVTDKKQKQTDLRHLSIILFPLLFILMQSFLDISESSVALSRYVTPIWPWMIVVIFSNIEILNGIFSRKTVGYMAAIASITIFAFFVVKPSEEAIRDELPAFLALALIALYFVNHYFSKVRFKAGLLTSASLLVSASITHNAYPVVSGQYIEIGDARFSEIKNLSKRIQRYNLAAVYVEKRLKTLRPHSHKLLISRFLKIKPGNIQTVESLFDLKRNQALITNTRAAYKTRCNARTRAIITSGPISAVVCHGK